MNTSHNFWSRVEPGPINTCWEWQGCTDQFGYGFVRLAGKLWRTHRLSFYLAKGELGGSCVLHSCDNRLCCNPDHLSLGTRAENNAQRDARKRHIALIGTDHPQAKLTSEKVIQMRELFLQGMRLTDIARQYSVNPGTAYNAIHKRTWSHV